jgi:hypothetical protein|tara:strand:+ start:424 stop:615 length:192 start_codon:yes stop_codon:yes gene_type:complete
MVLKLKWLNIFFRDIFLIIVVEILNFKVNFESWWLAFLSGAMVVLVSWHFEECRREYSSKKLK